MAQPAGNDPAHARFVARQAVFSAIKADAANDGEILMCGDNPATSAWHTCEAISSHPCPVRQAHVRAVEIPK